MKIIFFKKFLLKKKKKKFWETWSEKFNTRAFFKKGHLSLCYLVLQSDFKK